MIGPATTIKRYVFVPPRGKEATKLGLLLAYFVSAPQVVFDHMRTTGVVLSLDGTIELGEVCVLPPEEPDTKRLHAGDE